MREVSNEKEMEELFHDLKIRLELLEGDRKAYFETSQWAIRQNKLAVQQLKAQNKQLSEVLTKLKKMEIDQQTAQYALPEIEKQNQQLCNAHKKCDELQAEVVKRHYKLNALDDQLEELKREAQLVKATQYDSPQAKEIRMLENRLDKAMIKYNEAQSIRKTYEEIVKKLKEERLTFDTQLATLDKLLKAKKADVSALEKMFKDANHAKDLAKTELAKFEQKWLEDRKLREKELAVRREQMKQKMDFSDKFDRKMLLLENARNEAHFAQDSHKDQVDDMNDKRKLECEKTLTIIKEATGVSDVTGIIQKIDEQKHTQGQMVQLQQITEERLADLKQKLKEIQSIYEEIKYSSQGPRHHSEVILQELKTRLAEAKAKALKDKVKGEHTSQLLTDVEAGIRFLYKKMDNHANLNLDPVQMLEICFKKLQSLSSNIKGKDIPESYITTQAMAEPTAILQVNPAFMPSSNLRIAMKPLEFEEIVDDDEEEMDYSEDVPSREYIKKQSQMRMEAQLKGKPKKSKKKKNGGKDQEDDS